MNASRAKKIQAIMSKIEEIKAEVEDIQREEQEQFDKLSTKQQEGDKGERLKDNANELESAVAYLGDAFSGLENAVAE